MMTKIDPDPLTRNAGLKRMLDPEGDLQMLVLEMVKDKHTKHTVRFTEITDFGERGFVGSLYLLSPVVERMQIEDEITVVIGRSSLSATIRDIVRRTGGSEI
jgi:hypothetical protein